MKNVIFSRLVTMSHPEIQNGKEAMKTSNYQKDLEVNVTYMKILMVAKKVCV